MTYYILITDHNPKIIVKPQIVIIDYLYEGEKQDPEPANIRFTVTPRGTCTFRNGKDTIDVPVILEFSTQYDKIELLIPISCNASNVFVTAELIVENIKRNEHKNYNIFVC